MGIYHMWLCRAGEPREKSEYLSGRLSSMAWCFWFPISALAHILLRAYSQNLGCSILHCHKSATTLGCLPLPENVVTSVVHSCLLLGFFCPYTSSVLKKQSFSVGLVLILWGLRSLHQKDCHQSEAKLGSIGRLSLEEGCGNIHFSEIVLCILQVIQLWLRLNDLHWNYTACW